MHYRMFIIVLAVVGTYGSVVDSAWAQGEKNQIQRTEMIREETLAGPQIQQQKGPETSGELYRYQHQQQEIPQEQQRIQEQQRTDTAGQHALRIQNRFSYYADRLDEVAAKLQTLLAALAKIGVEVETANTTLVEAQAAIWHGRQLGEQASQGFLTIEVADYEQQQRMATNSGDLAKQAQASFKKALQLLKQVLLELR